MGENLVSRETPAYLAAARGVLSGALRDRVVNMVAENPEVGVPLGGGLRKARIALPGSGKSGGVGANGVDHCCEGAGRGLEEEPMTRAFDKIADGIDDARAYLKGGMVG